MFFSGRNGNLGMCIGTKIGGAIFSLAVPYYEFGCYAVLCSVPRDRAFIPGIILPSGLQLPEKFSLLTLHTNACAGGKYVFNET